MLLDLQAGEGVPFRTKGNVANGLSVERRRQPVQADSKPPFVAVIPTGSNSTRLSVLLDAELALSNTFVRPSQPNVENPEALGRSTASVQTAGTRQGRHLTHSTQPSSFAMSRHPASRCPDFHRLRACVNRCGLMPSASDGRQHVAANQRTQ